VSVKGAKAMFAWCLAGLLVLGAEVGEEKFITSKYPVTSKDDLAKAEKLVAETYGKQLQAAKTPIAQTRLAQELLQLAKDYLLPAQKYVLAQNWWATTMTIAMHCSNWPADR
jgi:hypothetical protein